MIKLSTYDELREQLGQEMGLDPAGTKPLSDQELLQQFYQCKYRQLLIVSKCIIVSRDV